MSDLVTKFRIGQLVKYGRFLGLITELNEANVYIRWFAEGATFNRSLEYGIKSGAIGYCLVEEMEILVDI